MKHSESDRFGSAAWADPHSLQAAGLIADRGLRIGHVGFAPLALDSDAPMLTIGGAGSGKQRDLLTAAIALSPHRRMMILDPRGELAAVTLHNFARTGSYAYCWNPLHLHGLPHHPCNPLDLLRADSPTLVSDCKFIAEGLVPLPPGYGNTYFLMRARGWAEALLRFLAHCDGSVSFPALGELVDSIEGDAETWGAALNLMLNAPDPFLKRVAAEIVTKQQEAPKEFGAILGTLYNALGFLDDPLAREALSADGFSLSELVRADRCASVFLNIPAEFLSIWSPLIRVFFTVAMLVKGRAPAAPRLHLIVDEAGQLGSFEALLRAFTYGRGAGVRAWAIFQDAGQIKRNFGDSALQSFIGSAQLRQFFGVRDYETAKLVSDMLGAQTLHHTDTRQNNTDRHAKRAAILKLFTGADSMEAALGFVHHRRAGRIPAGKARALLAPDEVLALREDQQILFISGLNLRPILANKYPFYTRPELAGRYLPNPYHPPADRVRITTATGMRELRVITAPVPPSLAPLPQYHSGLCRYVDGDPAFIREFNT